MQVETDSVGVVVEDLVVVVEEGVSKYHVVLTGGVSATDKVSASWLPESIYVVHQEKLSGHCVDLAVRELDLEVSKVSALLLALAGVVANAGCGIAIS